MMMCLGIIVTEWPVLLKTNSFIDLQRIYVDTVLTMTEQGNEGSRLLSYHHTLVRV